MKRRQFVRSLAAGASAAGLAAPPDLLGDEPGGDAPPKPAPSEADARMDLVVARFGKHLDANARDTVRAEVEAIVLRAKMLRKFPLTNGDGPFPVFTPYRAPIGDGK